MPGQRMTQPGQGESRKLARLTDFEFRVFEQVKLASDDFGVMPKTASTVKAGNLRLRKHATERQIEAALDRMIELGLLVTFEHQDETYVCAPAWQRAQTIEFPRTTHQPKPPAETCATLEPNTQLLFCLHPGGSRKYPSKKLAERILKTFENDKGMSLETLLERFEKNPEPIEVFGARTPANANANANASSEESPRETKSQPLTRSMKPFNEWEGQRLEVPLKWHVDAVRKLGGPDADRRLRSWYLELDAQLVRSQTPVQNWFRWLDAAYARWVPADAATGADDHVARDIAASEARRRSVQR